MAKDFAFLFYVNDWAGGTQWMTRLQRGAYIDLLLYQVNNTCFSLDEIKSILGSDFDICWGVLQNKFELENGKYYNKKMENVLKARSYFTDSRRNNRLGKKKKQVKNTRKTSVKLVGIENENEIVIEYVNEKVKKAWVKFVEYKEKEHGFKYKTKNSEQIAVNELIELCNNNYDLADKIVNQTISNGWKGLFKVKDVEENKSDLELHKQKLKEAVR